MDTDNKVVKARGGVARFGWSWAKWGEMEDICNSVNSKINK